MQLSRGARVTIWGILLIGCAIALYLRGDLIWRVEVGPADKGLMILLAALLIWPLVAEIDLFGVKLKAQLQAAAAVRPGILRADLPDEPAKPASMDDSQALAGMEIESIRHQLAAILGAGGGHEAAIPRASQAVLAPAFLLQSEVLRLSRKLPPEVRFRLPEDPVAVAWNLARLGELNGDEMAVIREILTAAAKAVNGASITPGQARFAIELGPVVWKRLRERAGHGYEDLQRNNHPGSENYVHL